MAETDLHPAPSFPVKLNLMANTEHKTAWCRKSNNQPESELSLVGEGQAVLHPSHSIGWMPTADQDIIHKGWKTSKCSSSLLPRNQASGSLRH